MRLNSDLSNKTWNSVICTSQPISCMNATISLPLPPSGRRQSFDEDNAVVMQSVFDDAEFISKNHAFAFSDRCRRLPSMGMGVFLLIGVSVGRPM